MQYLLHNMRDAFHITGFVQSMHTDSIAKQINIPSAGSPSSKQKLIVSRTVITYLLYIYCTERQL